MTQNLPRFKPQNPKTPKPHNINSVKDVKFVINFFSYVIFGSLCPCLSSHIDSSLRSASVLKSLIEDLFKPFDTSWFDLESEFEFIAKVLEFTLMLFRPNHNNGQLIQIRICWVLCPCIQLDDFVW